MKHSKRILSMVLTLLLSINLFACDSDKPTSETPAPLPDLSGQWKQVNSESDDNYQGAIIDDDRIEIYWVSNNGDTRSLYWSGSFDEPDTADEPYSWKSKNNTGRTANAIMASQDETKEFTYENNQISYSSSILGTTTKVRLEKEKWAPGLKIEDDAQPSMDISEESEPVEVDEYGTFPFVIAGVEFSIPDYYEKSEEQSTDEYTFRVNKGDLTILNAMESADENFTEKYLEERLEELSEEYIIDASGLDEAEVLSLEDISVAGLPGKTMLISGRYDGVNTIMRMDIIGNPSEKKIGFLFLTQAGNPQYDYLADYEKMIETAKLITPEETNNSSNPVSVSGVRPEFKEAMDSYEAFFDEYIAFMERYNNSNNSMDMLTEYTNYMSKYTETMVALSQINDGSLSTEELAYYVEVNSRITQKLLMASQ